MNSKFLPKLLLVISILAFQGDLFSQTNQWTWVGGNSTTSAVGVYGTQGQPSANNIPGSRYGSVTWTDNQGRLWMFGGKGLSSVGGINLLNDLWRYDPVAATWTWVNGSNLANAGSVYGTKGQPSASNNPGARSQSVSWTDNQGNLWMFGGSYNANMYNDLWRFDVGTGTWTWISGSNTANSNGVYGTKGQASTNNVPGAREEAVSWKDNQGRLLLFGGRGNSGEFYNDLWRFDPVSGTWTWVSGSNIINMQGVYGVKGQASANNNPGARTKATSWTDSLGRFWLFGGYGYIAGTEGLLNDLWCFDPVAGTWTWMSGSNTPDKLGVYGTKGQVSLNNSPGSRMDAVSWTDSHGELWMFGGNCGAVCTGRFNDLWRFDPVYGTWTWMNGYNLTSVPGIYGTQGQPSANNYPGSRGESVTWTDSQGRLWLFGGDGYSYIHNDFWRIEPGDAPTPTVTVTSPTPYSKFLTGSTITIEVAVNPLVNIHYVDFFEQGTKLGTDSSAPYTFSRTNIPTGTYHISANATTTTGYTFKSDSTTILVGGPYDNEWTWMSGNSSPLGMGVYGIYGVQGEYSSVNRPGSRFYSETWTDNQGRLWMFGGTGLSSTSNGLLNDMWRYDPLTRIWTWVNGSKLSNAVAVYGSQGVGSVNNNPGARAEYNSWTDKQGNFWLFGGTNGSGSLNDLWHFDVVSETWTWISGSNTVNAPRVYGTKGVGSTNNNPGAREGSVGWTDKQGRFWLFGGFGYGSGANYLNDLWCYDPAAGTWTWVSGSNTINTPAVYGTKGQASPGNIPGARTESTSWTDSQGRFWLFGGYEFTSARSGLLNDLWLFDPVAGTWTWVSGSDTTNTNGLYGTKGQSSLNNSPGSRSNAVSWTDSNGQLWMFGGDCATFCFGRFNDLWRFDPVAGTWTWVSGKNGVGGSAVYGLQGFASPDNTPGARLGSLTWTDNKGLLYMFGGYDGIGYRHNDMWRFDPASPSAPPANQAPTANAGADQLITLPTSSTSVSGSGTDPDGTISAYAWTKVSGPAGDTINSPTTATTSISGLLTPGTYIFRFTVTDNSGASAFDDIQITVNSAANQTPTANAGADQTITRPTSSVTLNGSGTDPDGTISSYAWSKVGGPSGDVIATPSTSSTTINGLVAGIYIYRLTVTDNTGALAFDDIQITVNSATNLTPTANAGADQNITLPTSSITLNGSGTDPDGTISSYVWSKVSGPAGDAIATPATASTNITGLVAGTYTYRLTVTDNGGSAAFDDVQIIVNNTPNQAPTANAGADQTLTLPTGSITLSGSGTDPDGTISAYSWTKISGPAGGTIASPTTAITNISDLIDGIYVYKLTVTDNLGATGTDDVQITVELKEAALVVNAGANPSASFTLNLQGTPGTEIRLTVIDIYGRTIESRDNLQPNTVLQLGQNWKPGIHIVHVQQGKDTKVIKLVKQ